jgi:hypothetical protein
MYKTEFLHHSMCFGIVVGDWGDASGAETAATELKQWVRTLSSFEARSTHSDLVKSDAAYGDNPTFDTPTMLSLYEAATAARRAGMEASGEGLNDGHDCACQLVPITDQS